MILQRSGNNRLAIKISKLKEDCQRLQAGLSVKFLLAADFRG